MFGTFSEGFFQVLGEVVGYIRDIFGTCLEDFRDYLGRDQRVVEQFGGGNKNHG